MAEIAAYSAQYEMDLPRLNYHDQTTIVYND
jgi:hypothetical protein